MGVKWSKNQHLKYSATMKRKRDERIVKNRPLNAIPVQSTESVGEEMLRLARLGIAHNVSDRNLTGLLVHFVHVFAAAQATE